MSIIFKQVSFSYEDTKNTRKEKNRRAETKTQEGLVSKGALPHARWALQNINFEIKDGEFFGIAGHSGSGKSTLIQHMNGLLKPDEGEVKVNGVSTANKGGLSQIRAQVGMVFQYPEHQLFAASVFDDIAFGPRNLGLSSTEVKERVYEALEAVQLKAEEVSTLSPFALSGGQQRRVAFAGVLAMRPHTLVLDEPTAGLDPHVKKEFLRLIDALHTKGQSIVMVSHNMDDLASYCERILVLNQGKQFSLGTPEHIFSNAEALHDIGLEAPCAQRIATYLRSKGIGLKRTLYDKESLACDLGELYFQRKDVHGNAKAGASAAMVSDSVKPGDSTKASASSTQAKNEGRPC